MLGKEEWVLIRALSTKFDKGASVSELARQTGHDRKTIRKYLSLQQKPGYNDPTRQSKLDPYKNYIMSRLNQVPEITNQRLQREIKEQGYTGSRTILGDFTYPLREKKSKEAVIRFETMPGEQSQVDWSLFGTIEEEGTKKRLYCFSMVLGFSRTLYIEFTTRQDIFTFLGCHQNAFIYFGGYTRTILYDNLKTVVVSRCQGNIEYNSKFMDFAGFYGFEPKLCQPYRAQTKGKVERPFIYIKKDFFIGNEFKSIDEINKAALYWLNSIANTRVHGTTKEAPFVRLKKESLLPITNTRVYDTSFTGTRRSSKDSFICYEGNRYSVPYQYSLKSLSIKANKDQIRIYSQSNEIALHTICKGKGKDVLDPKHFEGIKTKQRQQWQEFKEGFVSLSPSAKEFWNGFLSSSQMRGRWWELRKILTLSEKHSQQDVDYAFLRAVRYKAYGYTHVKGILQQLHRNRPHSILKMSDVLKTLVTKWDIPQVQKRSLASYDEFLNQ